MNAASDPTQPDLQSAAPTPLYPGPHMVPVDFTRLGPLPPPPAKENTALVRTGTAIAALGSVALVLSLFIVPWFFVREISIVQPPPQSQGNAGNNSQATNFSSFAPRIVQRDIHDFGAVAWASSRREKRAVAIVALAFLTQAGVLMSSVSYRWRLFLVLAGCGALAMLALTLVDYRQLTDLIRGRIALATSTTSGAVAGANVLKIAGIRPGTGMIALLASAGCVLFGVAIALIGGRRGKVLAPIPQ